ncbi:MAG: hypothetical protein Q8N23_14530 [Archangium sp.]|nr:hypothetical protein [Archangium sp.]MDP3153885.1 hypothetical protein [Archangium sp.]MDP3569386.1 hypothetical protein [Archangium sp.]
MMNHRDTQTTRAAVEEVARVADFLSVSTFLKPQFQIAVTPNSGELQVKVALRSADTSTRH